MLPLNLEIEIDDAAEDLCNALNHLKAKKLLVSPEMVNKYQKKQNIKVQILSVKTLNDRWFALGMSAKEQEKHGGCFYVREVNSCTLRRYANWKGKE